MKNDTTPQKLRAKEVANRYGISKSCVWNYVKQGLISKTVITRGVTVFDVAELDKFFSQNQTA